MEGEEWDKVKNQIWIIDKQNRKLDKLVSRRKKKRSYEYEVAWVGLSSIEYNRWGATHGWVGWKNLPT
jgi:elongation factor 3